MNNPTSSSSCSSLSHEITAKRKLLNPRSTDTTSSPSPPHLPPSPFFANVNEWSASRFKTILKQEEKEKEAMRENIKQLTKKTKKLTEENEKTRESVKAEIASLKQQLRSDPQAFHIVELHGVERPEVLEVPDTPNCYRVRYRYMKQEQEDEKK